MKATSGQWAVYRLANKLCTLLFHSIPECSCNLFNWNFLADPSEIPLQVFACVIDGRDGEFKNYCISKMLFWSYLSLFSDGRESLEENIVHTECTES